jgi:hypothetical protein
MSMNAANIAARRLVSRRITAKVRAAFPECEYIGNVGWCGPEWKAAAEMDGRLRREAGLA